MFGNYKRIILIHLYVDSEGTMESIDSTKQLERKSLRMVIKDLMERLINGDIASYQRILTFSNWVDSLTKEMDMHKNMIELLVEGNFELMDEGIKKVQCIDSEIKITNI